MTSTRKPPADRSAWTNPTRYRPRVYTWGRVRQGEVHPDIFPMEAITRVRSSLRTFNAQTLRALTILQVPYGTEEHPHPHFRVGWDAAHLFDASPSGVVRTSPAPSGHWKQQPAGEPKENSGSKAGEE